MERTYIHLNIVNVITISLAALLGYMVLVGSTLLLRNMSGQSSSGS